MTEYSSDSRAARLQHKLVQCCIDFINENNDNVIDIVSFNADNLQLSAKDGKWQPCTDSYCRVDKYNEETGHYEMDSENC